MLNISCRTLPMKNSLNAPCCFIHGVIAPSGRHVCERVRLAGALAWQAERWNVGKSSEGFATSTQPNAL